MKWLSLTVRRLRYILAIAYQLKVFNHKENKLTFD